MKFTNNPIKHKQLQFKDDNQNTYHLQIVYDTSEFQDAKAFWKTRLYKVNDERLSIPIYHYFIPLTENKKHLFHCSTRRKDIEGKVNLYQIVKQQAILDYTNREMIERFILADKS